MSVNSSIMKRIDGASTRSLARDNSAKSLSSRIPRFLNPAGPGDYDIPSVFGQTKGPLITIKPRRGVPPTKEFANVTQFDIIFVIDVSRKEFTRPYI